MPRNMSFSLTTDQIRTRTKTVTRRKGWRFLKPGAILNACVKCQGLRAGETIERLCQIRVVDVRREFLWEIDGVRDTGLGGRGAEEVTREGFPGMKVREFIAMFCEHMGGDPNQRVTRIEFEYL